MKKIVNIELNSDLCGYVVYLADNKKVYIQYDVEENRLHADFGELFATFYDADDSAELSAEEQKSVLEIFNRPEYSSKFFVNSENVISVKP